MSALAKRITLLLGAGSSIPAGIPTTEALTEIVLLGADPKSARQVFRHTDSTYYLDGLEDSDDYVLRIRGLLQALKGEIDRYYRPASHAANYEDLYYLASQIVDSELGEYDNPAVQPLIERLQPAIQLLLVPNWTASRREWSLSGLANEATHYIHDIVWRKLIPPTSVDPSKLSLLTEAGQSGYSVDIFTLNHDTVIDECLRGAGGGYVDGFGEAVNRVRYFNPEAYSAASDGVRLFKLHGSIDWFRYDAGIGIPLDGDYEHTVDPQGNRQRPAEGRPVMLVGTFNKILNYVAGIFVELQWHFYSRLKETGQLIVCGYSFGDKAINTRIVEWMYSSQLTRMIVMDPAGDKVRHRARGAIAKNWDQWQSTNRLIIIEKGIEQLTWGEVSDLVSQKSIYGMRGFLKGIDTSVERDSDDAE